MHRRRSEHVRRDAGDGSATALDRLVVGDAGAGEWARRAGGARGGNGVRRRRLRGAALPQESLIHGEVVVGVNAAVVIDVAGGVGVGTAEEALVDAEVV